MSLRGVIGLGLMIGISMQTEAAFDLPPIGYSGRLLSTYRLTTPSEGADTLQLANSAELAATSYIWQPWFGTWRGQVAASWVKTDAETDSRADLLTGQLDVNLFHRSHFPLNAYVAVQDSRVDTDALIRDQSQVRTLQLGLSQQYRDLGDGGFYLASLQRDVQTSLVDDSTAASNRLQATMDRRGEVHSFGGVLAVNQVTNSVADAESLFGQLNLSHSYHPHDRLSVENSAFVALADASSDFDRSDAQVLGLSSYANWRAATVPLRLRSEVSLGMERGSFADLERELDTLRLRGGGRYDLSENVSVTADVGADVRRGADESTITFQSLSALYNSTPVLWREFTYNWYGGLAAGNRTETDAQGSQTYDAHAGHGVVRSWVFDLGVPLALVANGGQEVRFEQDTLEGELAQLLNRATFSAAYNESNQTTYLQVNAIDQRSFGREDTKLLTLDMVAAHNRQVSRYRNLDLSLTVHYGDVTSAGVTSRNDATSLEMRFRDGRLFGRRQLTFESRLRAAASWFGSQGNDTSLDLEWENQLDYRIGLLELQARTFLTSDGERSNALYQLSVARRF